MFRVLKPSDWSKNSSRESEWCRGKACEETFWALTPEFGPQSAGREH